MNFDTKKEYTGDRVSGTVGNSFLSIGDNCTIFFTVKNSRWKQNVLCWKQEDCCYSSAAPMSTTNARSNGVWHAAILTPRKISVCATDPQQLNKKPV